MNNFYENIELYLDNELAQDDKIAFENALKSDEGLRTALAEEKATRATLYAMMTDDFRQRALAEDNNQSTDNQYIVQENERQEAKVIAMPQRQNGWYRWAIAAAMIGVLLTAAIYLNSSKSVDYLALSEKYTFDYPVPKVQDAIAEKQATDNFYSLIKAQKYQAALDTYLQLSTDLQDDEMLLFYKAYCLLKTKQYDAAQKAFVFVATAKPNPIPTQREPIEWYMLMAKLGEQKDIKTELKAIANDNNHSYQAKAKALLEEL